MSADAVDRLVELGRDREAAELAVREAGPAPSPQEEPVLGPLEQFEVLVPAFGRMSAAIDAEAFGRPTPCDGWQVRDLLDHMNGGARMFAAAFRGDAPRDRAVDGDPAVLREALDEFVAAVRAPGALDQMVDSPFGTMPGDAFARLAAVDLLVHTWDLGQALGQEPGIDAEVVDSVDAFARQAISPEIREQGFFGPEVEPPVGAGDLDRLAAFTGRRP